MTAPFIGYFDVYLRYPKQKISIFSFVLLDQTSKKILSVRHFIRSNSQQLHIFLRKSLLEIEAIVGKKKFLPVFQHTGSYAFFISKLSVPTLTCFKRLVKHCVEINKILPSCLRFIQTQGNAGKTLETFARDILQFRKPEMKSLSDTCRYHLNAIGFLNYVGFFLNEKLRNTFELETSSYLQARREILVALFITLWHMKRGPAAYFVNNSFEKYAGIIASARYCVVNIKLRMAGHKEISVSTAAKKHKITSKDAEIIRLFELLKYPSFQADFLIFADKEVKPILAREQQIELKALYKKQAEVQIENEGEEGLKIIRDFQETERQMHLNHDHYKQKLHLSVIKIAMLSDDILD